MVIAILPPPCLLLAAAELAGDAARRTATMAVARRTTERGGPAAAIVHRINAPLDRLVIEAGPRFILPVREKNRRSVRNVFIGFLGKFSDSSFSFRIKI
jgi:hypothetical protein